MNFDAFLKSVSKIENISLPGEVSQVKMSPPFRTQLIDQQRKAMKWAKKAGVLALFYPNKNNETHFVLMLRKAYNGVHSAQVSFPGGQFETQDVIMQQTALRETFEEIGVPIDKMRILKEMTQLYIPPSNFKVFPFLATTENTPTFIAQNSEVEMLIEVPLSQLFNDENIVSKPVMTSYKKEIEVPVIMLNNYTVWGATAMILSELKDLLKQTF